MLAEALPIPDGSKIDKQVVATPKQEEFDESLLQRWHNMLPAFALAAN
jgi:hypothetical protein